MATGYATVKAESFDPVAYLAAHDERLLLSSEGRRVVCRLDPLLFSLIYLRHHLRSDETGGAISFSRFHLDFYEAAKRWVRDDLGPAEMRDCWIAPRGSGKSTLAFLILPLWCLAFGHRRYIAAFADAGPQAQLHLASLKRELDTNQLLQRDFPDLCAPAKRPGGASVSDNQGLYVARSGVAMMARGIDSSTLGAKVGNQRPDLLLFDDIEPPGALYSEYQKEKRLSTVIDAVFAMNPNAVVTLVGTVTMSGSIVHDIVRQVTDANDPNLPKWPRDENIRPRYYPALYADSEGREHSLWPERWSLDYLQSIRHTASFALNFMNDPRGADGAYWARSDIRYGTLDVHATRWILSVDPAVTTKGSSDWTGLAVVGYAPPFRDGVDGLADWMRNPARRGMVEVAHAEQVKLVGEPLRQKILRLLAEYPRIKAVRVEVNQGGELWQTVLHHMPPGVKLLVHTSTASKEVRFAEALDFYQRLQVAHRQPIRVLEEQQVGFPKMAHDDVVDAACSGILYFLSADRRPRVGATTTSYVGR